MIKKIADGVQLVSLNVENLLFEGMWEMPHGVTLNTYIVQGEETAIIDGFCGWDGIPETLYELLDQAGVSLESIRHLVVNHMEPDHSGWIEDFQKLHKDFEIWATKEAAAMIRSFYRFEGTIHEVKDGDTLDLGGKILRFTKAPNVHWPDTMMTLDESTGCLFCCDAFGAFGKLDQHLASEHSNESLQEIEREQLRYYAGILGTFATFVGKGIDKAQALPVRMICPGHGLIWDGEERMERIYNDYRRYVQYSSGKAKESVAIVWGTMYGNTQKMVEYAKSYLLEKGVPVTCIQVPETDLGTVLMYVLESKGLVFAAPTYEYKMFPPHGPHPRRAGEKACVPSQCRLFRQLWLERRRPQRIQRNRGAQPDELSNGRRCGIQRIAQGRG